MDVTTGRVVRFDRGRGYGFIAPDGGGDDVFVHTNDLEADGHAVAVGTRVRFQIVDGGRGLKAFDVRVLADDGSNGAATPVVRAPQVVPAPPTPEVDDEFDVLSEKEFVAEVTELLVNAGPTLTAGQIVDIRKALAGFARAHGWVE
ncbi:cold-shock protein [Virgisporangium aurantiacum]|nr:cold shock domain-containing protein [Virgisporangium aurantiacum]